jgi:hypothetical protein
MLDVRPTAYIVPLAEQVLDDITPVVQVTSAGDEAAQVTGLIRIYRQSTDQLLYTSELAVTIVPGHTTVNIAALSAWSPPAPADDDYFILCDTMAISVAEPTDPDTMRASLGAWHFDIKPGPMGPAPAAHHATHENGGMDEISVAGLHGVLGDTQPVAPHAADHMFGGPDQINVQDLPGVLADDQPALAHDIAGARHTSAATPGQILQADANGLPVDASNTNTEVTDAVSKRDCRANGEASNAAPTPNADTTDLYYLTALAEAATFGAPTGTPVNGQKLLIRILDNGTARALAWNNGAGGYIARGVALPTTTVLSKYLYVGLIYNSVASKWDCVASSQEA